MIARTRGPDGRVQWVALHQVDGVWTLIEEEGRLDFVEAGQVCVTHLQGILERALTATREAHACYRCGSLVKAMEHLKHTLASLEVAVVEGARLLDQPGPADELSEDVELVAADMTADERFLHGVLAAAAESYRETGVPVSARAWLRAASLFQVMAEDDSGTDDGTP